MNGKGSGRRPAQISQDEFAERWAATFGPPPVCPVCNDRNIDCDNCSGFAVEDEGE